MIFLRRNPASSNPLSNEPALSKLTRHPVWTREILVFGVFFLIFGLVFCRSTTAQSLQDFPKTVWLEAESFSEKGGWIVDNQMMDVLGSPVLLAHGMGEPVVDAQTAFRFPAPGAYQIFVRTRNWVSPWIPSDYVDRPAPPDYAPGRFQLAFDGKMQETEFGTSSSHWAWQRGGVLQIDAEDLENEVLLTLHDLTGFDGRVDAICLTADDGFVPPNDRETLDRLRRQALNIPETISDARADPYDLVVVGGGLAGTCAAVAAARLGCDVALIQNRPVLGGNGSTEVRVHLNGQINQAPYPNLGNLTSLMGPLAGGNAREAAHYKDQQRLELVQKEPSLDLYLNVQVNAADVEILPTDSSNLATDDPSNPRTGDWSNRSPDDSSSTDLAAAQPDSTVPAASKSDSTVLAAAQPDSTDLPAAATRKKIVAVYGQNIETGQILRFQGTLFADCTGDGNLGFLAGADWRMGRESRAETGEPLAPEQADSMIMGASIQWNTVETDTTTTFPTLPWAIQFTSETISPMDHGDWDWETGLNNDPINDIEQIRDNGLRAAYGHWSYMKNQMTGEWAEKVRTKKLGWVSFLAGKRESRRLLGDVILNGQNILQQTAWDDASVTTTWSIDLHYPDPQNALAFPGQEFRTICEQISITPYAIPYRCFYSRNVENLFMAGRDISVTHVALGSIRVMRTGGMMGEVVGMAASLCKNHRCHPRDIYRHHLDELKTLMSQGVAPSPDKSPTP